MAEELELASEIIASRNRAALSQAELAGRTETTQSALAPLGSGKLWPSRSKLQRRVRATGDQARG